MLARPRWMDTLEETIRRTIADSLWDRDSESIYTFDLAGRATAHPIATADCRKITANLDDGDDLTYPVLRDMVLNTNDREFCGAPTDTLLLLGFNRTAEPESTVPTVAHEVTFVLKKRPWGDVCTAFGWIKFVDDRGCPLYEQADFDRLREATSVTP